MKKLITLTLALLMLALPVWAEERIPAAEGATLTVTGSASVTLKADYAKVSVGVLSRARSWGENRHTSAPMPNPSHRHSR